VLVCTLNFGAARKNVSVQVGALNFGVVRKNVGVQDHVINLSLHDVHIHNNDVHGVYSVGRAQKSFVGANVMWVYVVVRQFS
jgi:hypothetical protein